MAETIRVSKEFRDVLEAHRRDDETMEQTLRRLIGGPSPETLATVVAEDDEQADALRAAIERKRADGRTRREELRDRFE